MFLFVLARTAGNVGVTLDDQLSFTADVDATTWSCCRLILHNIRRMCLFLTQWWWRLWSRLLSSRVWTTGWTLMWWWTMFEGFFCDFWHNPQLSCLIWKWIRPLNVLWFVNSPCMPEEQVWPLGQPGGWRGEKKLRGRNCSTCLLTGLGCHG